MCIGSGTERNVLCKGVVGECYQSAGTEIHVLFK